MRKYIILVIALIISALTFAQEQPTRDYKTLKGLSFGVGLPFEMRDLPGSGITFNIGYDCAYPINDQLAIGFYITERWYIMGELTYHVSLAGETATLEPAIRVGYNFGRKQK